MEIDQIIDFGRCWNPKLIIFYVGTVKFNLTHWISFRNGFQKWIVFTNRKIIEFFGASWSTNRIINLGNSMIVEWIECFDTLFVSFFSNEQDWLKLSVNQRLGQFRHWKTVSWLTIPISAPTLSPLISSTRMRPQWPRTKVCSRYGFSIKY